MLAHGTTRSDNEWPEAAWAELGRRLVAAGHRVVLPQAGAAEAGRVARLAAAIGAGVEVLPPMPLDALARRMAACAGVIGVDSGLSHLAVALDLRHVQIFSQPRAWRAGPVGSAHQLAVGGDAGADCRRGVGGVAAGLGGPARERGSERMIRRLYSWLTAMLSPAVWLRLHWRGRKEPLYRAAIGERFGRYRRVARRPAGCGYTPSRSARREPPHRSSRRCAGSNRRCACCSPAAPRPGAPRVRRCCVRATTRPGCRGTARARRGASSRSIGRCLGVLMETEVWPNLLHAAKAAGVPMVLANARLSERSRRRGERLGAMIRPAAESLALVLAQTEADAVRLRSAGARQVEVCGNLKFDMTPGAGTAGAGAALARRGQAHRRPRDEHARGRGGRAARRPGRRSPCRGRCC